MSVGVFVIAEMSTNHCGYFDLAKKIIAVAKEASRRLFVSVGFIVDDAMEAPFGFWVFKKII